MHVIFCAKYIRNLMNVIGHDVDHTKGFLLDGLELATFSRFFYIGIEDPIARAILNVFDSSVFAVICNGYS